MEVKLLGYGLKVSPPIESQVKWFKQKYCFMHNILYVSSFGWDNEKVMITCENGVFYEYVKVKFQTFVLFILLDFILLIHCFYFLK